MRWRRLFIGIVGFLVAIGVIWSATREIPEVPRASGPMPQSAYVWQRRWDADLRAAIAEEGPAFDHLVAIVAEVRFERGEAGLVHIPADRDLVDRVALRIGPTPGPFDDASAATVADIAATLVDPPPAELQIDFDAGSAQLAGYTRWIRAIRQRVAPVPVTITALPDWLDRPELPALLAETDGWVLQVHGVPAPGAPEILCDPVRAVADVERAARLGVPFRVALPTYAYATVVDENGARVGMIAEAGEKLAPGLSTVLLEADPADMAGLVATWTADRPDAMEGIVWFRLPVPGDQRNASWPALQAMMAGRAPASHLTVDLVGAADGLWDVTLASDGEGDARTDGDVCIAWSAGPLVAADAYAGYTIHSDAASACFVPTSSDRLPSGSRRPVGWLRLPPHESPHVLPAAAPGASGAGVRAVPAELPARR